VRSNRSLRSDTAHRRRRESGGRTELGTWVTMPSELPLGVMVALCMGCAPAVLSATMACPPS